MSAPDGPTAIGVSLWLMPEGEARQRLASCIDRLARRLGTPPFPPHVTLLPGLRAPVPTVLAAASGLARARRPFLVRLSGLEGRDEHFRCVYARVEPSRELEQARAGAVQALAPASPVPFEPHLSLVYGALDGAMKAMLARELVAETRIEFRVGSIGVWRTEGEVASWREIGSFDLVGSRDPTKDAPDSSHL